MTENEQIEEMAKSLCGEQECGCDDCNICEGCIYWIMASELYAKGYRKVERGEWKTIERSGGRLFGYKCSLCDGEVYDVCNGDTNFCPHCGADMRGE